MDSQSELDVPEGLYMSSYLHKKYPYYDKNNYGFDAKVVDQIENSLLLNSAKERSHWSRFRYDYFVECATKSYGDPFYKSKNPYVHRMGPSQKQKDLEVQVRIDIPPPQFCPREGYYLKHRTLDGLTITQSGDLLQPDPEQETDSDPDHDKIFDADKILEAYIEYCDAQLQKTLSKLASNKRRRAGLSTAQQPNSTHKRRKRDRSTSPPPRLSSPVKAKHTFIPASRKKRKSQMNNSSSSESDLEEDSESSHSGSDSDDSVCEADATASHDSRHSDSSKSADLSSKKGGRKSQPKCSRSKAGCQGEHSKKLVDKHGPRMTAFNLFFKEFCESGEGKVQASDLQKLNQSLSTGDPKKLTSRELGQCCAARLCKTKPGGQTWYHGLILRTQAPTDAGKSRTRASID